MNNFIVGFGLHLSKHSFKTGYTFYFPVLLGKRGFLFYIIFSRPFLKDGTRLPLRIVPRFRLLNKGVWHHLELSLYCVLFCVSRGYHFLISSGESWQNSTSDDD